MQPDNRTWDPGRVQDDQETPGRVQEDQENKLFQIIVPDSTCSLVLRTAVVSVLDVSEENDMEESVIEVGNCPNSSR
jgi:hypothetical protein